LWWAFYFIFFSRFWEFLETGCKKIIVFTARGLFRGEGGKGAYPKSTESTHMLSVHPKSTHLGFFGDLFLFVKLYFQVFLSKWSSKTPKTNQKNSTPFFSVFFLAFFAVSLHGEYPGYPLDLIRRRDGFFEIHALQVGL
jgi:hypothetical protein